MDGSDARLRARIRELGQLLGEALARQPLAQRYVVAVVVGLGAALLEFVADEQMRELIADLRNVAAELSAGNASTAARAASFSQSCTAQLQRRPRHRN